MVTANSNNDTAVSLSLSVSSASPWQDCGKDGEVA